MKKSRIVLIVVTSMMGAMLAAYFGLTTMHPRGYEWAAFGANRAYALQVTGRDVADIPGGPIYSSWRTSDGRMHRTAVGFCIRIGRFEALTAPAGTMYLVH